MALQGSGQISISNIASEMGLSLSDVYLGTLSTAFVNTNSVNRPDGLQPHYISEFYGYDHAAGSGGGPTLYEYTMHESVPEEFMACTDGPRMGYFTYWVESGNIPLDVGSRVFMDRDGMEPARTGYYFDDNTAGYYFIFDGMVDIIGKCK